MTPEEWLKKEAARIAKQYQARVPGASKRLAEFQPTMNGEYQCPRCWIGKAESLRLHPYDPDPGAASPEPLSDLEDDCDHYKCRECDFELIEKHPA